MDRKQFFSDAFKLAVGKTLELASENVIVKHCESQAQVKQRPPGAGAEPDFLRACTGCDACMSACPYNVIYIEDLEKRDPVIYPETSPCQECSDYPCIAACPTQALSLKHSLKLRECQDSVASVE